MLPTTRTAAFITGVGRYYTGKPCIRGHIAVRTVSGGCVLCKKKSDLERLHNPRTRSAVLLSKNKSERYRRSYSGNKRAYYLWNSAKHRAKKKKLDFSLTLKLVEAGVNLGICAVTGLKFDLGVRARSERNPFAPSIDRINNKLGYTDENCRIVVWIFNTARGEWGDAPLDIFVMAMHALKAKRH